MTFQTRSTTISVVAWQYGIRLYTQSADGDIREGCKDQNIEDIGPIRAAADRLNYEQAVGWYCGDLHAACDPGSTLCSLTWGNTWNLDVFYQTHDRAIHETRHSPGRGWSVTDFLQQDAMPGTDLAEVHSASGDKVILFFQDNEGYLCYRRAHNWQWDASVRLTKALTSTAITATTWSDTNDIRVYYQDEGNTIREYCGSFQGEWSMGQFINSFPRTVGSIAAVSWVDQGVQIRIYMQDTDHTIVEEMFTSGSWSRGEMKVAALPNSDIAAFTRTSHLGRWIHVYWAAPDKILHQKIFAKHGGWLAHTPVGYLKASGNWAGSVNGTAFTDIDSGVDRKRIRAVHVRSGAFVDGFNLEFVDGSSTPWRGGQGGVLQSFTLEDSEDIVQVLICSNKSVIQKMSFITSNGRQSIWFGIDGQRPDVWEFDGSPLAGFAGWAGQYLHGLEPLWSERPAVIGPAVLNGLIEESQRISSDILNTAHRRSQLGSGVTTLQNDFSYNLHAPAELAVESIVLLSQQVQKLSQASEAERNAVVARCKGISVVAGERFEVLQSAAAGILKSATELAVEITYQESTTQSRIKRVGEMKLVSGAMRVSEVNVRQMRLDRVADAKEHIATAERTRREAEHKRHDAEVARIVRDIFTFGLGELGDWGSLNAAMDYADKLIASAEANLNSCYIGLAQTEAGINRIDEELVRFDHLTGQLASFGPILAEQVASLKTLLDQIYDLENNSLDASVFLSALSGKATTLFAQHSAKQLAASVIAIETLMGTGNRLTGAIISDPDSLNAALAAIAESKVEPTPADELM